MLKNESHTSDRLFLLLYARCFIDPFEFLFRVITSVTFHIFTYSGFSVAIFRHCWTPIDWTLETWGSERPLRGIDNFKNRCRPTRNCYGPWRFPHDISLRDLTANGQRLPLEDVPANFSCITSVSFSILQHFRTKDSPLIYSEMVVNCSIWQALYSRELSICPISMYCAVLLAWKCSNMGWILGGIPEILPIVPSLIQIKLSVSWHANNSGWHLACFSVANPNR